MFPPPVPLVMVIASAALLKLPFVAPPEPAVFAPPTKLAPATIHKLPALPAPEVLMFLLALMFTLPLARMARSPPLVVMLPASVMLPPLL